MRTPKKKTRPGRLSTDWSPLSSFLYGLQVATHQVYRSSLRRLICPAQDHLIVLTLLIISMIFVLSLTKMLVFLYLCDVEHIGPVVLPILVCAAASLFCALFGQCPGICAIDICHSWQHTGVVHLSLQADGN